MSNNYDNSHLFCYCKSFETSMISGYAVCFSGQEEMDKDDFVPSVVYLVTCRFQPILLTVH